MKKAYEKPLIEIEEYGLNCSIAANCDPIVGEFGPGTPDGSLKTCSGFPDIGIMVASLGETSFYQNEPLYPCDCYYTSGGEGYFTS